MARFKLTEDAREDLREIKGFSQKRFGALVAREYLAGMRITLQHLAAMPGIGTDETAELLAGVWSFPYMSHTIYYQPVAEGISVIGIIHQSRMPGLLLKRER
ncbi:type II toxin-antitoxin system RelE/ParE family toxin [Enterobacteriaceae bacterium H18W14]|uniref:type II toxin-antitoxin system RelE/ParE family toxin n=1 Tax=Dryocola boscaweniae TaxID=2925397 RepID=UPI0022F06657|nr:type II toxin-antitoxin system RelE/ParE family toxin [Dryocola boscaweniae]MCT4715688.1 type II toxin-antitoxin system RelE/ParE family toxin [Dryocola boscaweniae]